MTVVADVTLSVKVTVSPRRTVAGLLVAVVVHPLEVAAVTLACGSTTAVNAAPTTARSANRPNHRFARRVRLCRYGGKGHERS